jgi:glycosyltransferase involved in cell wall biosynthesis
MRILIVNNTVIPAKDYGGTERVIWWLGRELVKLGHEVIFLVAPGSICSFAKRVLVYDPKRELNEQIPVDIDLVHVQFPLTKPLSKPYVVTHHGNGIEGAYDINTIFVSSNHAKRNGSDSFVVNGIDPDEYGPVDFNKQRRNLLFLASDKRPEKNLEGCIDIAFHANERLTVVGGRRRFNQNGLAWWVKYYGMLGGVEKNQVINASKALLFPVLWHEPCGIAILEAMYFGLPVFGTTYGSLPELVSKDAGYISNSKKDLIHAVKTMQGQFDSKKIHDYVCDQFSAKKMAEDYLKKYEIVLQGKTLNSGPLLNSDNYIRGVLLPMDP